MKTEEADELQQRIARKERATTLDSVRKERKGLFDVLNKGIGGLRSYLFAPEEVVVLTKIVKSYIAEGIRSVDDIVRNIYNDLNKEKFPGIEERDIRDAVSNYGKTSKPNLDALALALAEWRRKARLVSALEDATAGDSPKHSGWQPLPKSDEVRNLEKQVKQAMRESGIDLTVLKTPEEQWKPLWKV